jgi:hypothetical protein
MHMAVGCHEVPRGHLPFGIHAGEQRVGLGILQGHWAQSAAPVPREDLLEGPATEAAVRVVEDHGLFHDAKGRGGRWTAAAIAVQSVKMTTTVAACAE